MYNCGPNEAVILAETRSIHEVKFVQSADRTPYSQDHRATTMEGSPLRIDEGRCYDENSLTELGPDEK